MVADGGGAATLGLFAGVYCHAERPDPRAPYGNPGTAGTNPTAHRYPRAAHPHAGTAHPHPYPHTAAPYPHAAPA